MKGRKSMTREQFEELAKSIDPEEFQKVVETAKECHDTIKSSVPYYPIRVSDLTVTDFNRMLQDTIRSIVKEEIGRILPIYQVPNYQGFEIPRTPGEQNQGNTRTFTTNYTVFEPHKFPMWNYGYKEDWRSRSKFDNF